MLMRWPFRAGGMENKGNDKWSCIIFYPPTKTTSSIINLRGILNSAIWPRNNINIADENARFHLNSYFLSSALFRNAKYRCIIKS